MDDIIGQRVVLIHTGDEGVVTSVLDKDTVNVLLSDDVEIPVNVDDLKLYNHKTANTPPKKKEVTRAEAFHPTVLENKTPITHKGILVSFETRYDQEGNPERYKIYLINDTTRDVVFNFNMSMNNGNSTKLNGLSNSNTAFPLGEIILDELNEVPLLKFECWPTTTSGRDKQIDKTIKVKAKQFFKKIKPTPIIKGETHLYELIPKLPSLAELKNKVESLSDYTQRVAEEKKKDDLVQTYYSVYNIKEKAEFKDELDLHIEALVGDSKKMNSAEKLHLQIETFEKYLDEAVRVGFERVFIIHGLGKGRLRDIIASRLIRNEQVKTFKNDYHPKYGFGATEVIF